MVRRALGCFEQLGDGSWICRQSAVIKGLNCTVQVYRGQRFQSPCTFAGYDDFTVYLAEMSEEYPDSSQ